MTCVCANVPLLLQKLDDMNKKVLGTGKRMLRFEDDAIETKRTKRDLSAHMNQVKTVEDRKNERK